MVGVGDASGQDQGVELLVPGDLDGGVDLEGVPPVEVVERLDAPGLGGHQQGASTGLLDGPPGLDELDLLGPSGATRNATVVPLSSSAMATPVCHAPPASVHPGLVRGMPARAIDMHGTVPADRARERA